MWRPQLHRWAVEIFEVKTFEEALNGGGGCKIVCRGWGLWEVVVVDETLVN